MFLKTKRHGQTLLRDLIPGQLKVQDRQHGATYNFW